MMQKRSAIPILHLVEETEYNVGSETFTMEMKNIEDEKVWRSPATILGGHTRTWNVVNLCATIFEFSEIGNSGIGTIFEDFGQNGKVKPTK
uniref:PRELI/MSF1 domain-containing protein n=1 Tax=Angiostrongylus cantonensis TaxID=6313 RepID=A0A0K0DFG0_ANGCA